MNPAFAEDRFENDGASVLIDGSAQSLGVVTRNEFHILKQRFKTFTVFVLPGHGHGSEAASVVRACQRDQLAFRRASRTMSSEPCQLNRTFNRFGAAV